MAAAPHIRLWAVFEREWRTVYFPLLMGTVATAP